MAEAMLRPIRLVAAVLLAGTCIGAPLGARAMRAAATTQPSNLYFTGLVTQGPDRGTRVEGLLALDGAGGGNLTLGNGSVAPITTGASGTSGMALTATLAPNQVIHGTGAPAGMGTTAGTFTGPRAGDSGAWSAGIAVKVIDYAITGTINAGPNSGKQVLIGDLYGFVTADGTMFGKYVDNSKAGPGITSRVYPVHGTFMNNMLTAGLAFSARTTFALVGRTRLFYGQNSVTGFLVGPSGRDSGTWAGVDNSSAA